MILILCDVTDPAATWVGSGLRRRLAVPVQVVTATELASVLTLEHRISDAATTVRAMLPGGRVIDSDTVSGVLLRLRGVPEPLTPGVPAADRAYAQQELAAITLSWLHGLLAAGVPFVGRPDASGLPGPWLPWAQWCLFAAAAGLDVAEHVVSGHEQAPKPVAKQLLVVAGRVVNARPSANAYAQSAVLRLARLADADVLAAGFDTSQRLVAVDLLPDLRLGGEAALDALSGCFARGASGS